MVQDAWGTFNFGKITFLQAFKFCFWICICQFSNTRTIVDGGCFKRYIEDGNISGNCLWIFEDHPQFIIKTFIFSRCTTPRSNWFLSLCKRISRMWRKCEESNARLKGVFSNSPFILPQTVNFYTLLYVRHDRALWIVTEHCNEPRFNFEAACRTHESYTPRILPVLPFDSKSNSASSLWILHRFLGNEVERSLRTAASKSRCCFNVPFLGTKKPLPSSTELLAALFLRSGAIIPWLAHRFMSRRFRRTIAGERIAASSISWTCRPIRFWVPSSFRPAFHRDVLSPVAIGPFVMYHKICPYLRRVWDHQLCWNNKRCAVCRRYYEASNDSRFSRDMINGTFRKIKPVISHHFSSHLSRTMS